MTGAIQIANEADVEWRGPGPNWPGRVKPGEPDVFHKPLLDIDDGRLQVRYVRYEPHHFEPPHSHAEDEILYLTRGEIHFGDQVLKAGTAMYVRANSRYSLKAGDEGVDFVKVAVR